MKRIECLCLVSVLLVAAAGCKVEKRVDSKLPGPPSWVVDVPQDTEDEVRFVGIGLAENILDERTARNRAMEDMQQQIASSLKATVIKNAREVVTKSGPEHRGKETPDSAYRAEVTNVVDQAMSGVRIEGNYWEKWKIKRGFFLASFTRYKYYVLGSMPREDYERLQDALTDAVVERIQ
jgi:hypothetical protein